MDKTQYKILLGKLCGEMTKILLVNKEPGLLKANAIPKKAFIEHGIFTFYQPVEDVFELYGFHVDCDDVNGNPVPKHRDFNDGDRVIVGTMSEVGGRLPLKIGFYKFGTGMTMEGGTSYYGENGLKIAAQHGYEWIMDGTVPPDTLPSSTLN